MQLSLLSVVGLAYKLGNITYKIKLAFKLNQLNSAVTLQKCHLTPFTFNFITKLKFKALIIRQNYRKKYLFSRYVFIQ